MVQYYPGFIYCYVQTADVHSSFSRSRSAVEEKQKVDLQWIITATFWLEISNYEIDGSHQQFPLGIQPAPPVTNVGPGHEEENEDVKRGALLPVQGCPLAPQKPKMARSSRHEKHQSPIISECVSGVCVSVGLIAR